MAEKHANTMITNELHAANAALAPRMRTAVNRPADGWHVICPPPSSH